MIPYETHQYIIPSNVQYPNQKHYMHRWFSFSFIILRPKTIKSCVKILYILYSIKYYWKYKWILPNSRLQKWRKRIRSVKALLSKIQTLVQTPGKSLSMFLTSSSLRQHFLLPVLSEKFNNSGVVSKYLFDLKTIAITVEVVIVKMLA